MYKPQTEGKPSQRTAKRDLKQQSTTPGSKSWFRLTFGSGSSKKDKDPNDPVFGPIREVTHLRIIKVKF